MAGETKCSFFFFVLRYFLPIKMGMSWTSAYYKEWNEYHAEKKMIQCPFDFGVSDTHDSRVQNTFRTKIPLWLVHNSQKSRVNFAYPFSPALTLEWGLTNHRREHFAFASGKRVSFNFKQFLSFVRQMGTSYRKKEERIGDRRSMKRLKMREKRQRKFPQVWVPRNLFLDRWTKRRFDWVLVDCWETRDFNRLLCLSI